MTIKNAKKIVIKIGSSLVANYKTGRCNDKWLESFIKEVAYLKKNNKKVIIVSSGAVALGKNLIKPEYENLKLEEKQAAAACGQIKLLEKYQKYLKKHKLNAAQVLLTIDNTENRRNYLNAKNTMETLINANIIPIINENDTVATEELRFGDNDRLSARVAQMLSADLLVILSDVNGLYSENPGVSQKAKLIRKVKEITPDIENMASGAISKVGSGGMITKIGAAKIVMSSGCNMIIANGTIKNPIKSIEKQENYTIFESNDTPLNSRKNWIAHSLTSLGSVVIDDGALSAIRKGKSLLPAGIVDILGTFKRGDTITIQNCKKQDIGKGITAYSSKDAKLIMGHQSQEIENIIGFSGREELIHTNDLVINDDKK